MNDVSLLSRQRARSVQIIGVACGQGAGDPRCEYAPEALRSAKLISRLHGRGFRAAWIDTLHPSRPSSGDDLKAVYDVCKRLAQRVEDVVTHGDFPVVIGGDHSCAIGTWKGIARSIHPRGPLGLVWIDAHMDAHTPETTPSGMLHGMPVACLLGHGEPLLTALAEGTRIQPEHICLVGVRSFEASEAALLKKLGVRVIFMEDVARQGLDAALSEALTIVQRGTAGFGVTIDLDVVDPHDAPGVGTPAPGGIRANDLVAALTRFAHEPALVGAEIVEYNPYRDRNAATAGLVVDVLDALLSGQHALDLDRLVELEQRYGAHHYDTLPVALVRGQGVYLWDNQGRRYIDMMSAYSAASHGHCHPRLTKALSAQAHTLTITSRAYYNNRLPPFLERLCEVTGFDMALPANTGLEAVETALKAVRKWGTKVKGVPEDRVEVIACEGNFHGRSIAILAMSSEPQYRDGFGPYPPGFRRIPYGDAAALEWAITPHTAAFLVEPIQGEAGIVVPPAGYLAECARICRAHHVLLVCDEVQTGLGRTGRILACEHEGVRPDGVILGKALGGGLLPVSAFLARREVMSVFTPGDHGSTFGGNPLAATVGLEALNVMVEERLPERAAELGGYLLTQLRAIRSPLIREVRGKGLLIGIEIDPARTSARAVCNKLIEHGVLSKDTHHTVVRFAPPLVITRQQIDTAVAAVRKTFDELETAAHCAA
ncbi:MAG: ornithine--oxo-acid transaminase [Pseudomonadota bacterium]